VRYAYAITAALLFGGTAATLALQAPGGAQTASDQPVSATLTSAPRPGAPMSFADLAAKLQPAVVNISVRQKVQVGVAFDPFSGKQRPVVEEQGGSGSGFLIASDGYIVTNNHVISGGPDNSAATNITVTMTDRREFKATLVGRDVASDLALLKINATNMPYVAFGDSTKSRVGDWVVAIGNPYGLGSAVTAGIISALQRNTGSGGAYDRFIQTDTAINQGNSGGPLFDLQGNVVGINNRLISMTGGNVGINFAIPAEQAIPIIKSLKAGAKIKRGYLGIQFAPLDEETADSLGIDKGRGEFVANVLPGQAADKAGLKAGDVVVRINDRDVTPDNTLSYLVSGLAAGSRVPIEVLRDGKRVKLSAVIGERPAEEVLASRANGTPDVKTDDRQSAAEASRESLGLALVALTPDIARDLGLESSIKGAVIGGVDPASDAAQKGLKRGDVILSINQRPISTPGEVTTAAVAAKKAGRASVLLQVKRSQLPAAFITIKLREG
jgi:serine protease Do